MSPSGHSPSSGSGRTWFPTWPGQRCKDGALSQQGTLRPSAVACTGPAGPRLSCSPGPAAPLPWGALGALSRQAGEGRDDVPCGGRDPGWLAQLWLPWLWPRNHGWKAWRRGGPCSGNAAWSLLWMCQADVSCSLPSPPRSPEGWHACQMMARSAAGCWPPPSAAGWPSRG